MKLLVIDDEAMIRTIAEMILTKAGYEVVVADDGHSGIEKFRQEPEAYSLVLLDMFMEGLSGLETLEQIRQIKENTPCIISSGNDYDEKDIPSELNRNLFFLQKPYRANDLSQLVKNVLDESAQD